MSTQNLACLFVVLLVAAFGGLIGWTLAEAVRGPLLRRAIEAARKAQTMADCWRERYGHEQHRFARLRSLFERQRDLDQQSQAARPHELRDIEQQFRELCPPVPTRRTAP